MAEITLDRVSVAFPIYNANTRSLKKRVLSAATGGLIRNEGGSSGPSVVQALDEVTLDFRHGDRVGLVGHNGAGKTTLLRVLAGIYEPARGTVRVEGHIAPLFDIALGMDPESTGYENIALRGLFLGFTQDEIRERMQDIAEFTELGSFLNLPLRTYSTGMYIRLAFAVSTSIKPDILLLDEGIGAGDAAFLDKAKRRLEEFTREASIIVLASHSESLVRQMCRTSVLLEHGRVIDTGDTEDILALYRERQATSPAKQFVG